jgi:hypothetical protein
MTSRFGRLLGELASTGARQPPQEKSAEGPTAFLGDL